MSGDSNRERRGSDREGTDSDRGGDRFGQRRGQERIEGVDSDRRG